ncbi:MAG: hypothetical protein LBN37_05210, partial [Bacteroidales bacterium]|nr:hypothetical protein [Bacteroidales bacterium]
KQQLENQKSVVVEKIVEKPVEKIVEKIIEKPVEKIVEVKKTVHKTNPAWIVFCCIFGVLSLVLGICAYEFAEGMPTNQEVVVSDEAMQQQLSYKQTEIETLQGEVSSLKQQLAAAGSSDNSARLQSMINDRDNEISKLKNQLVTAQKSNTNTTDLQKQITQLKADKTSLQNQLATAKSGLGNSAELQQQINSKNSEINRLKNDITSLEQQLKDKQKKLDAFINNM